MSVAEWKTIEEFPNYEISTTGEIRHIGSAKLRKISNGARGYPVVSFKKDGRSYLRTVHILMARTFISNPLNKPQVNHIDGNKLNYSLSNLEWCTARENVIHARRNGLQNSDGDKMVWQYTIDGTLIKSFKSASEASRQTGIARCNICSAARGNTKYKTAGGYIWKYENNRK